MAADALAATRTGIFVGISSNDYALRQFGSPAQVDAYSGTGSALSIAANRISYLLDLRGPSVAVDTACSSSLVAVHLACQSLRSGESSLAIAGGVNALLSPAVTESFRKGGFMAPDGRCKAFDAGADGYVRSEGAGAVVLKPLALAHRDGDPIYAVIRGGAVNQDGRSNGLTAPNRGAQEAVLRDAYRSAGVSPGLIAYVEAHGTGTALGDPIETRALGAVLGADRGAGAPCLLGSIKSNLGHLEAAAGIAGLIKVALALRHRRVPRTLHVRQPSTHLGLAELPLRLAVEATDLPPHGAVFAGVSSFGFGGTNAHLVLQSAPVAPVRSIPTSPGCDGVPWSTPGGEHTAHLLPLSARSPAALRALARGYQELDTAPSHPTRASVTEHGIRLPFYGSK